MEAVNARPARRGSHQDFSQTDAVTRGLRTTVTLDPDVESMLRALMKERGLTFKEALDQAVRMGLGTRGRSSPFRTPTSRMGFRPAVSWDKALRLAGEAEDDESALRLATREAGGADG